jgi:hemerythrin-like metal-binding protein
MKKILWDDNFSVGVKKMDVQHQKIIKIFNTLVDNAKANSGSAKVSEILAELVDYASEHFKCEEQLLRDHSHPDLAQQRTEHREFRRQAGDFCLLASKYNDQMTHDLLD